MSCSISYEQLAGLRVKKLFNGSQKLQSPVKKASSISHFRLVLLIKRHIPSPLLRCSGWLAGQIVKGYGFGLIGNIVIGIIGALIAGWLLPLLGFALGGGIIAAIINAVIGAVILLLVVGFFKKE
jgi:uncharacterized membrane protein YeaQ/YmgE (transglycosylase-associated protein family)